MQTHIRVKALNDNYIYAPKASYQTHGVVQPDGETIVIDSNAVIRIPESNRLDKFPLEIVGSYGSLRSRDAGCGFRGIPASSFIFGVDSEAIDPATNYFVYCFGCGLQSYSYSFNVGRYNDPKEHALFTVGNGNNDLSRYNAFYVTDDNVSHMEYGEVLYTNENENNSVVNNIYLKNYVKNAIEKALDNYGITGFAFHYKGSVDLAEANPHILLETSNEGDVYNLRYDIFLDSSVATSTSAEKRLPAGTNIVVVFEDEVKKFDALSPVLDFDDYYYPRQEKIRIENGEVRIGSQSEYLSIYNSYINYKLSGSDESHYVAFPSYASTLFDTFSIYGDMLNPTDCSYNPNKKRVTVIYDSMNSLTVPIGLSDENFKFISNGTCVELDFSDEFKKRSSITRLI